MDCDCKLLLIFKATVISEYASFTNEPNTITTSRGDKYTADHIVVAVGGEPTPLNVPGMVIIIHHLCQDINYDVMDHLNI